MADITLNIRSNKNAYVYGEALLLHAELKNTTQSDLYVVERRVYSALESAQSMKVIAGQIKPVEVFRYYDYSVPPLITLPAGREWANDWRIGLPPQESFIGADGALHLKEIPLSGGIQVRLEVGYGKTPFRPVGTDTLGEFISWQSFAVSNTVVIQLKPR